MMAVVWFGVGVWVGYDLLFGYLWGIIQVIGQKSKWVADHRAQLGGWGRLRKADQW